MGNVARRRGGGLGISRFTLPEGEPTGSFEARGQNSVQVTRTVSDYANCRTRTTRYKCTGQTEYLMQCHQMSCWVHDLTRRLLFLLQDIF